MNERADEDRLIWLNGRVLNVSKAKVGVLSPTAQFGLNVFEGIPCYWNEENRCLYSFRLKDHHERLLRSARLLQIECPYSKEELETAFSEAVRACGYKENISVRQTLYVDGNGSWGSEGPAGMFIAPIQRKKTSAEYNKTGLKVCVSGWRRISDTMISPRIKCGANYINSRMGQREALRNGYDTCVFLNENGKISEGPGSCFFMVTKGELITPVLTDSVLESITRDTVMRLAEEIGIKVRQRSIDRTEVYSADEAFLCGSAMEIRPVVAIDGYQLTEGYGVLTTKLHDRYMYYAMGNDADRYNWAEKIQ